jgi:hypothetical protein
MWGEDAAMDERDLLVLRLRRRVIALGSLLKESKKKLRVLSCVLFMSVATNILLIVIL